MIVHVKLTGLRLELGGQVGSVVGHMPFAEDALSKSVTELTGEAADLEGFMDGYAGWREAFEQGSAGWYTLSLAKTVETLEAILNAGSPGE